MNIPVCIYRLKKRAKPFVLIAIPSLFSGKNMPHKILVVGPSWVGDMVMAQCLFKLLKQQNPACQIDVLAPAFTFPLLSRMNEVARAIEMPILHGELALKKRYQIGKTL